MLLKIANLDIISQSLKLGWKSATMPLERLCPDGYKLLDHPRGNRRGGGTALLYQEFLYEKKVDAGFKSSYQFSEFVISSNYISGIPTPMYM